MKSTVSGASPGVGPELRSASSSGARSDVRPEIRPDIRIDPRTIGFDVDGVVANTMHLFIDIAREDFGVEIGYEEMTCYNLGQCLDVGEDVIEGVIHRLLDGTRDHALHPMDGVGEVLARLADCCNPVRFITARPSPEYIQEWILDRLPLAGHQVDLVATGSFEAKTDVLLEKGIRWFVEDRLETCFMLEPAGIQPILFRQPWNREPHPFPEVGSWRELAEMIDFP
jgi:hypothetical protein